MRPRYLEPMLRMLVHNGVLKSVRGPAGGYMLARDPGQITAADILLAISVEEDSKGLARSAVSNQVASSTMAQAEELLLKQFARIRVEDLMHTARRKTGLVAA